MTRAILWNDSVTQTLFLMDVGNGGCEGSSEFPLGGIAGGAWAEPFKGWVIDQTYQRDVFRDPEA